MRSCCRWVDGAVACEAGIVCWLDCDEDRAAGVKKERMERWGGMVYRGGWRNVESERGRGRGRDAWRVVVHARIAIASRRRAGGGTSIT